MFKREAEVGDKVECKGMSFTIKEILFQDCYNCDYDDSRSYMDLEFKDLNGGYHHWKSHLDGGKIIYKEDTADLSISREELRLVREFYDDKTGRFYIPFNRMTPEITEVVLHFMRIGYALSAYNDGDGHNIYTLFKLSIDCSGFRQVEFLKQKLYDWLHNDKGCHYFTKMSLDEYFSKSLYQNAVDYALLQGGCCSNNYTLVLRCIGRESIEFIEAKDCFA